MVGIIGIFNKNKKLKHSTIIPIIRTVIPNMLANEICSVQPMTGPVAKIHTMRARYATPDWHLVTTVGIERFQGIDIPDGYCVVAVSISEVHNWIEEQPIHLWKPVNRDLGHESYYIISGELYTALALRW